jgi:hypothetical protein
MVVALVALVVATAGTGYAAVNLPRNSVGAKHLKRNAVTKVKIRGNAVTRSKVARNAITGAKVKARSILGSDIRTKTLGKVPSASIADTANALAPLEPLHLVGAAGEPGFAGGGAGNVGLIEAGVVSQPVGFYKDRNGIVHLEGFAKTGTDGFIFQLPAGYRPPSGITQIFQPAGTLVMVFGSNVAIANTDVSGVVLADEATAVLSGLSFRPGS